MMVLFVVQKGRRRDPPLRLQSLLQPEFIYLQPKKSSQLAAGRVQDKPVVADVPSSSCHQIPGS